jgi:hypothetical protein
MDQLSTLHGTLTCSRLEVSGRSLLLSACDKRNKGQLSGHTSLRCPGWLAAGVYVVSGKLARINFISGNQWLDWSALAWVTKLQLQHAASPSVCTKCWLRLDTVVLNRARCVIAVFVLNSSTIHVMV